MTEYLISFDDGAMTFPEEDLPDVAAAANKVILEAKGAGVFVFSGGLESQRAIGGFTVVEVPSRAEALEWAAKIADACRCAQEVREFLPRSHPTD